MSGYIDRLEAAGLVGRVRSAEDRRRVGLTVTERGRPRAAVGPVAPHRLARAPPQAPERRRACGDRRRARAARAPAGRGRRVTKTLLRAHTRTFASLRKHRNYRLFFGGQVVSVSGTWMQNIATAWLVLDLTHSPVAVGVLAAFQFLPYTVFGLFAGVIVDRLDVRRTIIGTQIGVDALRLRARRADAGRRRQPVGGLPPDRSARHGARARRPRPAGAHLSDGRPRRAAERGRAQLEPVQRRPCRRPRGRRPRGRGGRPRHVLCDQRRDASSLCSRAF